MKNEKTKQICLAGPEKKPAERYPDVGDNVHANVNDWLDINCGDSLNKWFIPGQCEAHGHRYAKTIFCGKEWCPVCGKINSPAHNRRYIRWLLKVRQFKTARYFVITIPKRLRNNYRTKESLKDLGRKAQIILIKHGFKRGLRRWHWFGDKTKVFHPHLNVLVEGSYMKPCELMIMRAEWAEMLGIKFTESNFKAKYKRFPKDMTSCLNYVTRSTFIDYNYDLEMAIELRNFRNMVVWGRDWKQEYKWDIDKLERLTEDGQKIDIYSIEKLVEHTCPKDSSKMIWGNALPYKLLQLVDSIDIGAGFRVIMDGEMPPLLDQKVHDRLKIRRYEMAVCHAWHKKLEKPVVLDGGLQYILNIS